MQVLYREGMGEIRNAYKIIIPHPTGKRPIGRPKWEDDIKMDMKRNRL
jgi:hypothetical protein